MYKMIMIIPVFSAGMDLDCGDYTQKYTASAVQSGASPLSLSCIINTL